jgi:polyisoprenoid-binding protein YceI
MNNAIRYFAFVVLGAATAASAAPVNYEVDPEHTYPSFEADHFGGISVWRGKVKQTSGKIVLDRQAGTGSVDVTIDMTTIDSGLEKLNDHLKGPDAGMLDVTKFPTAKYKGKLVNFKDGAPTQVQGELTLHGVTKPVTLTVKSFKCLRTRSSAARTRKPPSTGKISASIGASHSVSGWTGRSRSRLKPSSRVEQN